MKGEVLKVGDWFANPIERDRVKSAIRKVFREAEQTQGLIFSPITWETLEPDDGRINGSPPDTTGIKLLVGAAEIMAVNLIRGESSFVGSLDFVDIQRLRQITRQAHREAQPKEPELTDGQCDEIIERLGPGINERAISQIVAGHTVH